MAVDVATTHAPASGLWRVSRSDRPLDPDAPRARDLRGKFTGNRYDVAGVKTLYFSSTLAGCYTEVLAPLRPSPGLSVLVGDEWDARDHWRPGCIPAGWRHRRTVTRIKLSRHYQFLDVEHPDSLDYLREGLGAGIATLGYSDLDFGLIHGPDRRVTRAIAAWAEGDMADDGEHLRFAGIRYVSRLDRAP